MCTRALKTRIFLLALFLFGGQVNLAAQDKIPFLEKHCLLPYLEFGFYPAGKVNPTDMYFPKERSINTGAVSLQAGFAKQLDDLKWSFSLAYFINGIGSTGSYFISSGVDLPLNYFEANGLPYLNSPGDTFNTSSEFYTVFHYAQLRIGLEKRFAEKFTIGAELNNSFLTYYDDSQVLNHRSAQTGNRRLSTTIARDVRGVRSYNLQAGLYVGHQVRRQKLKLDIGLKTLVSITSITTINPQSLFITNLGVYSRFYFVNH